MFNYELKKLEERHLNKHINKIKLQHLGLKYTHIVHVGIAYSPSTFQKDNIIGCCYVV